MTLPITETEKAALTKLGYLTVGMPSAVLEAYRAGFAEGATPPTPRVFRDGDPEPGPDITAVLDEDGDVWVHRTPYVGEWSCAVETTDWVRLLTYAPLVACKPLPDFATAVAADEQRRATSTKETHG
ncbi:MAG: hypothetical protein ACRDSP_14030 [Pseudonocardiaceae bacterium]